MNLIFTNSLRNDLSYHVNLRYTLTKLNVPYQLKVNLKLKYLPTTPQPQQPSLSSRAVHVPYFCKTAEQLDILRVGLPASKVDNIEIIPLSTENILNKYKGLGELKNFKLKLHINPKIMPKQ